VVRCPRDAKKRDAPPASNTVGATRGVGVGGATTTEEDENSATTVEMSGGGSGGGSGGRSGGSDRTLLEFLAAHKSPMTVSVFGRDVTLSDIRLSLIASESDAMPRVSLDGSGLIFPFPDMSSLDIRGSFAAVVETDHAAHARMGGAAEEAHALAHAHAHASFGGVGATLVWQCRLNTAWTRACTVEPALAFNA